MKLIKRLLPILGLILILAALGATLGGCAKSTEIDTSGMYLVIYDGNGGVLGNKTTTTRRLFCDPGSKIPDYPTQYEANQYTVSSLGLAMRQGYNLVGWYTSAEYTASANGSRLKLDVGDGYGTFEAKSDGTYVYKPTADETGSYIYIYMEPSSAEAGAEPDTYVLLVPTFDEENNPLLTVAPGFYICNSENDYAEIDDDAMRQIYADAYATKVYTKSAAEELSGYQKTANLTEEEQLLFAGFPRYDYRYLPAEDSDAGLDRFALVSGYVSLFDLFEADADGDYVEKDGNYVKAGADDAELPHYAVVARYVFTGDSTAEMTRYEMAADYWDFANDHVTQDKCQWDGEKYVLHLYAHWEKMLTVRYHYENGTGQTDEATTKLLDDNRTKVYLRAGETIGRKEIVPLYAGHTFVAWSKSADRYDPWDFAVDVFPDGTTALDLYAWYVEGTYVRIVSVGGLTEIGKNPAGKYLIVEDLDLGGKSSLFGLTDKQVFTGEILSFGKTISNFNLKLTPTSEQQDNAGISVIAAPIPVAAGAKISGLRLVGSVTCNKAAKSPATASNKTYSLIASGLIGKEQGETASTVEDCRVELTISPAAGADFSNTSKFTYRYTFGDLVAVGEVTASGCTSVFDCDHFPESGYIQITVRKLAADVEA